MPSNCNKKEKLREPPVRRFLTNLLIIKLVNNRDMKKKNLNCEILVSFIINFKPQELQKREYECTAGAAVPQVTVVRETNEETPADYRQHKSKKFYLICKE